MAIVSVLEKHRHCVGKWLEGVAVCLANFVTIITHTVCSQMMRVSVRVD